MNNTTNNNDSRNHKETAMTMTAEQIKRTTLALTETYGALAKEMAYSEHLRHNDTLDFLNGHIAKLEGMLETGEWTI